jgi:ATP-dependent helicase/nuclease subunit A
MQIELPFDAQQDRAPVSTLEPAFQADGRHCTEAEFYALACDPARSAVIEACAGAGKTWMLVSRMLRALLDGAAPGQILAITFTRKAAAEMRMRLHEWLREFATTTAAKRVQALTLRGLSATQARQLEPALAGLHAQVLADGEALQISTFHSWFAQLMRLAPLEMLDALGLQSSMTPIEAIDDQLGELMRRFQRDVLDTPSLLDDYRTLTERHGRSQLGQWLRAAIERRTEVERADARRTLYDAIEPAAWLWPACAKFEHPLQRLRGDAGLRRTFGAAAAALMRESGNRRRAGEAIVAALALDDARRSWVALHKALLTQDGHPRKLGDAEVVSAAMNALRQLAIQIEQQDAREDHQRMVRLARRLLHAWQALKRERALVDMQDLERCALALLSEPATAGWLQQRLDVQLRHVLIDEFQDTSNLQWQALQSWLSSYAGAGGGASGQRALTVFIVGDPKQSIYRFRGAEPLVFEAARRFVVAGLGGHDLACNHTRRNAAAVIDAVNAVFERATAAGDYAGFVAHSTQRGGEAPGHVWHLPDPLLDPPAAALARDGWRDSLTEPRHEAKEPRALDEARRVAQAVRRLVDEHGIAAGDVTVLARRRASLALVADALRAQRLPCVAAEELHLGQMIEVLDLVAVLDALASNGNDLSLAQALKSPLFGASDDELRRLALRADRRNAAPWWSALQAWHDAPPALARARTLLARWAADARHLPPHDLLDRVVDQGEWMPRLAAAVQLERLGVAIAAVNALLELSLSLDGGRHASVYRFVRALRQRALSVAAPAQPGAVQLLTIHGVKGLEARCVFVVDTEPNPQREAQPGVLVDWPVDHDAPQRVAFVADVASPCASLVELRAQEQAAAQREEMNALYVAMTRARDWLLFSRTAPRHDGGRTSWWTRINAHSAEFPGAAAGAPDTLSNAATTVAIVQLPRLVADGLPQAMGASSVAATSAAQLGRAVHRLLQWASAAREAIDFDAWARAAAAEFGLPPMAASTAARYARTIHDSPPLQRFFDRDRVAWSADEFDVVHAGQMLRIDRLVRLGDATHGTWWVLDYKLAADAATDPALREQLGHYRAAVQALVGAAPVHAAFVTGDGVLHELAPAGLPS